MIFTDESTVKIDSIVLPGLFKSIEIKGDAIVDEQEIEGQSKKPKQATGYEDFKINLELILEDGPILTKMQKLEVIQQIFKTSGQERPSVHEIVNEHTAVRGIRQVIFKNLTHKAESKKSQLTVTLEFWEYTVMTITATEASQKTGASGAGKTGTGKSSSQSSKGQTAPASGSAANKNSGNLSESYQTYLKDRGSAPAFKNTPAQDTATGSGYLGAVKAIP